MGNKSSFTVYFTCEYLKGFWRRRNTDVCNDIMLYYIISVIKCKTRNRKENSKQYSSGSCLEMRPHMWWMSFEIGIVWEDVDEILNHPVAEVVLLLEEERKEESCHCQRALFMCRKHFQAAQMWKSCQFPHSRSDVISFSTYHSLNHVRSLRA